MPVTDQLETLAHRSLEQEEAHRAFAGLLDGELSDIEIAAFLAALKTRGETAAEIAGAALALLEAATPFPRPAYPVADTCGTGGDGAGTVNLSTAAAFVAAAAGIPVAKHGNRAVSSRSGSADVLESVGVRLDPRPEVARSALDRAGVCFLYAPAYHPGIRRVMTVRHTLKTRTMMNLLGPLVNPARPSWQVMGVYAPHLVRPLAETLGRLGRTAALVVHGGGLDELALHGPTQAARWHDGRVTELVITPEDAGLARIPLAALAGGTPAASGEWLRQVLAGLGSTASSAAVAMNAGALLWIAGAAPTLRAGVAEAAAVLRSGAAGERLERLVEASHDP
jgi:anthranilate phosphoribosyltransferase